MQGNLNHLCVRKENKNKRRQNLDFNIKNTHSKTNQQNEVCSKQNVFSIFSDEYYVQ